ncbi:MAG: hypothetical protein KOO60_00405 [Gemmatimonadales bacterium]|nr:hypothetical protein [Gemmatimonadales bacterium]
MDPIVIGLIVLAMLVLGGTLWYKDQKRQEALRAWARRRKWKLSRDKRKNWDRELPGLKVFAKGHSRWGKNVITGTFHDRPVTMLDYKYTTGHGKHRTNHRVGVAVLHCDYPTIPLFIRRENPFDKVGEFLGVDDIDFESVEFSRKFYVKSADKKWAFDIIHTRTMEYLLSAPSFNIEYGFGEIAVYRNGWCDVRKFEEALDVAWNLYSLTPDFVIQQMKGSSS